MKALRHIGIFIAAALALCSCGLSKVKDIAITGVGVAYIVPTSARSADAKLLLGIDNPARSLAVHGVSGVIRYHNKPIAHFTTGPLELEGKTEQTYELPCSVVLDDGASLLEVLLIASKSSLEGLKADVDILGALKKNGILKKPVSFRDLDISQFKK